MTRKKENRHLLVIRLSAMGDVAMVVPVLIAFHQTNPDVQITFLTKRHFAPIFSGLPWVHIHEVDEKGKHKGLKGLWKLFKEIKAHDIDAVGDLHNVLRSKILGVFFKTHAVPFVQLDKGRKEKRALTRKKPKELYELKTTHERYAEVFHKLGFTMNLDNFKGLPKPKPSDKTFNKAVVKVGIAPFASFPGKMYPLHLMKETIQELLKKTDCQVYLFGGGKEEKQKLDGLADQFVDKVVNLTQRFSFQEELTIISNLDLMVSMDSGNGHLAANYGVPVITIWGVTHPCLGFAPFKQPTEYSLLANRGKFPHIPTAVYGNKLPKGYERAMETIRPMAIVGKIIFALDKSASVR